MAGRRRQILQLESGIGRSDSGGKNMKSKLETHPANPLLGMMSSYHSDNEDEHQDDSEEKVVEENESSHVTVETTGSKQSQLDKQVADFLRTLAASEEVYSSPKEADNNNSDEAVPPSNGAMDEAQEVDREAPTAPPHEVQPAISVWVACVDTNSGYTYYWNKLTNDVSWTLPDGVELSSNARVEEDEQKTTPDEEEGLPQALDEVVGSPRTSDKEDGDMVEFGPQPLSSLVLVEGEVDDAGASECDTVADHTASLPAEEPPNLSAPENADSTEPRTFAEVMVGGALVGYHATSESEEDSDIDDMLDRALSTHDSALVPCEERKGLKRQADVTEADDATSCKKLKESGGDQKEGEDSSEEDAGTDEERDEQSVQTKEEVEMGCDEMTEMEADPAEQTSKVATACKELNRRLTLLGATITGVHPLILELIKLEARTTDWQNGALTAEYLVQRLQETTQLLADYEALVPPPGWTYVWDSDFERYYYYNSATDRASWDYPTTDASTDQPQEKSNTVLSTTTSVTSQESCASAPTTPPPGVNLAATPPPVEEEWQGPPPPPPPLEEGEIPPSPPTPPTLEEPDLNEEDGGCDAEESYQLESGPQLYYGPQAPPPEVPAAEEDSTPSGSRNASPAPEDSEPKKKKKKVVKVKMHGRKGKAVSSLLQKWAGLQEGKS